jgi:hypothetical protein
MSSMTVLLSRAPLQSLDMSAVQRPKRKATKLTFDEDEEAQRDSKRNKTEALERKAGAKANGAASRRNKPGMPHPVARRVGRSIGR